MNATSRPPGWDDDPAWAAARARSRDEVRAAFAARTIVCRECGHEATTAARCCPDCGHPYVATREPGLSRRAKRRLLGGLLGAAALLALLAALIVPGLQRSKRESDARERAFQARLAAAERRQLAVDQRLRVLRAAQPAATLRRMPAATQATVLRGDLERAITADASARVRARSLKGPIVRTECSPWANAPRSGAILRYECTAVNAIIPRGTQLGGVLGYPFWAKADARRGRLYWCKVNPKPGERATSSDRLTVPLDPRCDLDV